MLDEMLYVCLYKHERYEHQIGCIFIDISLKKMFKIINVENRVLEEINLDELTNDELDKICWFVTSGDYNFTPEQLEKYKDRIKWEFLSVNETLTMELIGKYSEYVDWSIIAHFQDFTKDFFEEYEHKLIDYIDEINLNPKLDFDVKRIIKDYSSLITEQETFDECIVCYEPTKTLTPCKHLICKSCINEYLNYSTTCAYCRQELNFEFGIEVIDRINSYDYPLIPDNVRTADDISDTDEESM